MNQRVLVQTEKISDQNPGMFWRAGVFEIRYFFFFIAAAINGSRVPNSIVPPKKFPR